MGTTVEFRGNLLFRWNKKDELVHVLLPHLPLPILYGHDYVRVDAHHAGIRLRGVSHADSKNITLPKGSQVWIETNDAAVQFGTVSGLLPLLRSPGTLIADGDRGATVHMRGSGEWVTGNRQIEIGTYEGKQRTFHTSLTYVFDSDCNLRYQAPGGSPVTVPLAPNDWLCVYNDDMKNPDETELFRRRTPLPIELPVPDRDFVGLYTLFTDGNPRPDYPFVTKVAPAMRPFGQGNPSVAIFLPSVSTCFPGGDGPID